MKALRTDRNHIAVFGIILALAVSLIAGIFYWLYNTSRENLINMWKVTAIQMARDVEYYMTRPLDAVAFASKHVEEMMQNGASNEMIEDYLISETSVYSTIVDSNTTGVYGYCRGEYLDGSGWIPEADYEPTERPWYVCAKEADGEITFVKPFLNLQTHTMTMSVSRLLYDGESVISMDIFLDGIQNMVMGMSSSDQVDSALVVDRSGFIVTHSDTDEIGRDYLADGSVYEQKLMKQVLSKNEATFMTESAAGKKMVFSKHINNEWTSVLIVDETKMLRPIQYIYLCTALAIVLAILAMTGIFLVLTRKHKETEQLDREVHAVAGIYDAMYLINITKDRIRPLRLDQAIENCLQGDYSHCRQKMKNASSLMAEEGYQDVLTSFLDLSTLEDRMSSLRSVSQEYLDRSRHWVRMRFVAVSREAEGGLSEILWALESIDEDKRLQNHLRELAETDAMTNVKNRRSGESAIRQMLADGVSGMFLLMDVDRFKSINDEFGHAVGDKVLIEVAASLSASMRNSDVVFRLGGDEFSAFAPGLQSEQTGKRVIDNILHAVQEIKIAELGERRIHVSIGVAFSPAGRQDSFEVIYRRADGGMYESKQSGGNCATFR